MTHDDILVAEGLVKSYGGVRALDGVSIRLRGGEVHALVGENGAGKSTLVRILSGTLGADGGTVRSAKDTRIAVVSQELSLFPDLTVRAEPVPAAPAPCVWACWTDAPWYHAARPVLAELGLDVDPRTELGELSPSGPAVDGDRARLCCAARGC
ncbi:ATP-binding cassette domain-containing protein [Streptomyces sp. L7]